MSSASASASALPVLGREGVQSHLFSGRPLYRLRLVREAEVHFGEAQMRSPADVVDWLRPFFEERPAEAFVVLSLNTAGEPVGLHVISEGGLSASIVEPRAVFQHALLANAASVVCAHNHPSGNPEPSREDVAITRQLVEAGKLMGIPVHDHVILAGRGFTSLAERGLM